MSEVLDVVNENNEVIGQDTREHIHAQGLWHRVIHVWIYNGQKEMLLQLRSKNKDTFPSKWCSSVSGHIDAGESPEDGALRELKEEIGLKADKEQLQFVKIRKCQNTYRDVIDNEIQYVYVLRFDGDTGMLTIQLKEIDIITYFNIPNLYADLEKNPTKFVPYGEYWIEMMKYIAAI